VINYRLASAINPPASPSTNLRFHRSSDLRLCFESVSDLRRRPTLSRCQRSTSDFPGDCILRSLLQLSLRLSPVAAPRVFPPDQLPILRRTFDLSAYLPTNLRLAPDIASSSLPSNPTPGFRQMPRLPAFLSDRPPTCVRYRILQFCLPINSRLIIGYRVSDFAFRSASDLRRRSIFQLCFPTNLHDSRRVLRPRAFPSN